MEEQDFAENTDIKYEMSEREAKIHERMKRFAGEN